MGFLEDLNNAVRGGVCNYLNNVQTASQYGNGIYGVGVVGDPLADFANNAARTGIGLFCDTPPVDKDPNNNIPGQCPTQYRLAVFATFTNRFTGESGRQLVEDPGNNLYDGPLGELVVRSTSGGSIRYGWSNLPANASVLIDYSPGDFPTLDPAPAPIRVDGQPDNCGGTPEPPTIGDRTIDIDINGDPGSVVIGLGGLTVNGDLIAPISITGSNFELTGTINFNKNIIKFNFGGSDPENNKCCDGPPETDNPPDEPDPPTEEDTEPANIVGVLVTIESINLNNVATTIFQDDNPDIYAPNVGYVNFRIKLGDSYGWSADYPVKNNRHFIPAPEGFQATRIAGTPRQGVAWTLTPVKGSIETIEIQ